MNNWNNSVYKNTIKIPIIFIFDHILLLIMSKPAIVAPTEAPPVVAAPVQLAALAAPVPVLMAPQPQMYIQPLQGVESDYSDESTGSKIAGFFSKHWVQMLIGVFIVTCLIFVFIGIAASEHLSETPFYLNQFAMATTDPVYYKYAGRQRDILGQDSEDYYLENLTYANTYAAPQLLLNNDALYNRTGYLTLPENQRPVVITGMSGSSGNVMSQEMGPESVV